MARTPEDRAAHNEWQKAYYQRNKAARLEYAKDYRERNREKITESDRARWTGTRKDLQTARMRTYNAAHKVEHNTHQRTYRMKNKAVLEAYKSERGCARCGESDPVVLQFHHVRGTKSFSIASRYARLGIDALLAEAEKCIILCANCHLREHADARTN